MKRIDENLKTDVRSGSGDKENWLKNHTLSTAQVKQLILNKYNRALKDRDNLERLKTLIKFE